MSPELELITTVGHYAGFVTWPGVAIVLIYKVIVPLLSVYLGKHGTIQNKVEKQVFNKIETNHFPHFEEKLKADMREVVDKRVGQLEDKIDRSQNQMWKNIRDNSSDISYLKGLVNGKK